MSGQQPDLFSPPEELSELRVRQLRDEVAQRNSTRAAQQTPEWAAQAQQSLLDFLDSHGDRPFTAEDVRAWSQDKIPASQDPRGWSAIIRWAAGKELIVHAGYQKHHAQSRHSGVSNLWKRR